MNKIIQLFISSKNIRASKKYSSDIQNVRVKNRIKKKKI